MALLDITGGTSTGTSNLSQSVVSAATQTAPLPDAFVSRSVSQKLDADYFTAAESSDVAESLSGSGNLNFASLQTHQNELAAMTSDRGDVNGAQDSALGSLAYGIAATHAVAQNSGFSLARGASVAGNDTIVEPAPSHSVGGQTTSGYTLASDAALLTPATPQIGDMAGAAPAIGGGSGTNGQSGQNGTVGPAGPAGQNGVNGTNGYNGIDGADGNGGHGCCGPNTIDIDISNITIINAPVIHGPIINGPILGDITVNLGDIINGPILGDTLIDLGDVTQIVTNVTQTVENIVNILPPVINDVVDIIDSILSPPSSGDSDLTLDLGLAEVPVLGDTLHVGLDVVEAIVGDIDVNAAVEGVLTGEDTTIGLNGHLAGIELPDISITIPTTVEELLTNPQGAIEDVLTGLPDTLGDVQDAVTSLLDGILSPPSSGDSDLTLDLGLADVPVLGDTLHVGLDVVEAIVGDIDVNAAVEGVLTGEDTTIGLNGHLAGIELPDVSITVPTTVEELLTNPQGAVEDVLTGLPDTLGDVQDTVTNLLDTVMSPPSSGDSDVTLDLGLADVPVLGDTLHVGLDVVEAIVGDIDVNAAVEGVLTGEDTTIGLNGHLAGIELPDVSITVPTTVEELLTNPQGAVEDVLTGLPDTLGDVQDTVTNLLDTVMSPPDLGDGLGIADGLNIPEVGSAIEALLGGGNGNDTLGDLIGGVSEGINLGAITGGVGGDAAWPSTPNTVENVVDSVLDTANLGGLLPPTGSVGEGLGLLDLGGGSGGLLGGGGKGGGLFGGGLFG